MASNDALLEAYLRDMELRGRSAQTIRNYRYILRGFLARLGTKPLSEVTTGDLRAWLAGERQPRNKLSTTAHDVVVLRSFFKWLSTEEMIGRDPARRIEVPHTEKRLPKYLTHEEIERLREACNPRRPIERAILETLYSTGCRVSELVGMDRRDLDWQQREIRVYGKGAKERVVQFSTTAAIWLQRYLKRRDDDLPALFVSQFRRRMSKASVERLIRKLGERAGVEGRVWPHRLRHSFASHMVQAEVPIQVVQLALGHENISTTQIYAHLTLQQRREHYRRVFA